MIKQDSAIPGMYVVQSFSNIDAQYDIVTADNIMESCTCMDFNCNKIACNLFFFSNFILFLINNKKLKLRYGRG